MAYLDGLRGMAIALVVVYHAYARWPKFVTFGNRFEDTPIIAQGKLGVELFFLISGYVIFMTLEKSSGFRDFMARRWLRLFPAMLTVTALLYVTAPLFVRPQGTPALRDLLPGITFIDPAWWEWLLGSHQGVLEGAFWSLFVEVKFYLVVGVLYFWRGWRTAVLGMLLLFVAPFIDGRSPIADVFNVTANVLGAGYWGWFIAGALYFQSYRAQSRWLFACALAISVAAALAGEYAKAAVLIAILFAATQCSGFARTIFSSKVFIFVGAISYPLYLVHENIMVSMIASMGHHAPWLRAPLVPIVPIGVVIGIGAVIAFWIEPRVKARLRPAFELLRGSTKPPLPHHVH